MSNRDHASDNDHDSGSTADMAPIDDAVLKVVDAIANGDDAAAAELRTRLTPHQRARLMAVLDDETTGGDDGDDDPFEVDDPHSATSGPDDGTRATFLRYFGGRRDLFAEQRLLRSGRVVYAPVRAPLTDEVVASHLAGVRTIGQYLLHPDGTCSFGFLDLDLSADALARLHAGRGAQASVLLHAPLAGFVRSLRAAATRLGLCSSIFLSGGRGVHLWLFFSPRRPARLVRQVLRHILLGAGPAPGEVSVELFPKQEQAGPRGLSSLVKLPFGVHRRTLARAHLLDDELQPVPELAVAMARLRAVDEHVADAVAGGRLLPLHQRPIEADLVPSRPGEAAARAPALTPSPALQEALERVAPRAGDEAPRDIAEVVQALPDDGDAVSRMLEGCAALRGIVDRAHRDRRLSPDEARAVVYTIGLVPDRRQTALAVLQVGCANPQALAQARRGRPAPMGCARLGRVVGVERCAGCRVPGGTPWPTPIAFALAHAIPLPTPRRPALPEPGPLFDEPLAVLHDALMRIERKVDHALSPRRNDAAPAEASPEKAEGK